MKTIHCITYNRLGQRMYRAGKESDPDDVFLPYRGPAPTSEANLEIEPYRTRADVIHLKNGVFLLPRNQYETYRLYLDRVERRVNRD